MAAVATKLRKSHARVSQRNLERASRLAGREFAFIPNASFKAMDDQTNWVDNSRLKAVEEGDSLTQAPGVKGLPAHLMRMCETPILELSEEAAFFRRMNYLKFKANRLRAKLSTDRPATEQLDEIEELLERAERIRNYIIQANTRLVMSIAKKFSDAMNLFDDVLSEGIASLMHTVEKFDFDRGFRLSTYATTSIQRDLYRFVVKNKKHRTRFSNGTDQLFVACQEEDDAAQKQLAATSHASYGSLTEMIDQLDTREKLIIRSRFGFDAEGGRKETYTSLGKQLGISKERVRQLAERAMAKLRKIAPEFGIAELDI